MIMALIGSTTMVNSITGETTGDGIDRPVIDRAARLTMITAIA